jgi:hypothetical protein
MLCCGFSACKSIVATFGLVILFGPPAFAKAKGPTCNLDLEASDLFQQRQS